MLKDAAGSVNVSPCVADSECQTKLVFGKDAAGGTFTRALTNCDLIIRDSRRNPIRVGNTSDHANVLLRR